MQNFISWIDTNSDSYHIPASLGAPSCCIQTLYLDMGMAYYTTGVEDKEERERDPQAKRHKGEMEEMEESGK